MAQKKTACFLVFCVALVSAVFATQQVFAAAPEAIDDLVVNGIGYDQITLGWAIPANGGSAITEYEIQQDSGTWDDISGSSATTVSHTVTGLTPGTSYTFKVRATNSDGDAPNSNTVTVIPNKFANTIPDGLTLANNDYFGSSAALSPDGATLAVGAWGDGVANRGAVHLFTKTGAIWTHSVTIDNDFTGLNLSSFDYFGYSTALSSDGAILAVGAYGDNTGGGDRGAVHLFTKNGDIWEYSTKITNGTDGLILADGDRFGSSAALSSDGATLAVGAYNDDGGGDRGAVHLFTKNEGIWTHSVKIDSNFTGLTLADNDNFGSSTALSSDGATLAVGAERDDTGGANTDRGAVHLFTKSNDVWTYSTKIAHGTNGLTLDNSDRFGSSAALSSDGTTLVVGAERDDTGGSNKGAVHLFTKNGTQWAYHSKIADGSNGLNLSSFDRFGYSTALSSDDAILAVGAYGDNTGGNDKGAAYLLNLPDTVAPYIATQTFTNSNQANGNDPKAGDSLTFSFTFSETLPTAPTISIEGASATFTESNDTYTATYQVTVATAEGPITYDIDTLTDSAGQSFDPPETNSPFTIDTTPPTLAAIADGTSGGDSHIGTTADTTPDFSFTSDEAGTIAYAGDCTSSETIAVSGTNTVSFNALTPAAYTNCAITVTDGAGNSSSSLAVPDFTIQQEPEAIDDLVVSGIGYDQITLKWTTPADGGSAITEYEIQQNANDWTTISGSDDTTVSHTVTGLTPGTSDTFKVRATNSNGAAPDSNTVTVIPNKFVNNIPDGLTLTNNDYFGSSAALSSDGILAVGAPGDNTDGSDRGAVYLFTKTGTIWAHSVKIDNDFTGLNLANSDNFGSAVALSSDGTILAVGALGDDTGGINKGAVHIFTKDGETWAYSTKVADGTDGLTLANSEQFGTSAALSSNGATLAVGAQYNDTDGRNKGAVYLFTKNGGTWTYSTKMADGTDGLTLAIDDQFGSSTALSSNGTILVVGAQGDDNTSEDNRGAVYLFTKDGDTWAYSVKIDNDFTGLTLANNDEFGSSAALSSNGATLAVGARYDDTGGANTNRGAVHLFTKNGTQWAYHSKIAHNSNGLTLAVNDEFGISAALSSDGATLAVGARHDDTGGINKGAAHLFNLPDTVAPYIVTQTFTNSTPANGNHPKTGDDLTFSFTFSKTLSTAPTVTIGGASATFTKTGDTYTATYTVTDTTPEGPITYDIDTLTDSAGQSFNPPETNSPFTIDTTAPTLAAIADGTSGGDSHIGTTTDTTPDFSFTSDEAGTIDYTGSCTSSETTAVSGTNTVSFSTLAYAAYTDCAVTVTDGAGNISSSLAVPDFTVQQTPEAIDDLVVSGIGYDQITLGWTTPGDNGSAITRYEIQQDSGTWTAIAGSDASTTDHTVTGLTPGTSDTFKVRAVNTDGNAPESNTVTVIPNKFTDTIPDGLSLSDYDEFGTSAALSSDGTTLAVGARYDDTGSANTGAVHLFTKNGDTWTHSVTIDSNFTGLNLTSNDRFGTSAALSSNGATLMVGAPRDNTGGENRGAVYLFTKNGDTWTYSTKIAHGTNELTLADNDFFGSSTALSSNGATLAVGAQYDDTGGANTNRGAVHLFTKTDNTWAHSVKIDNDFTGLTLADEDQFGSATALSSDGATLAVGAYKDDTGGANTNRGAVHLFTKSNDVWTYSTKIAHGTNGLTLANNDEFGSSAALSSNGTTLAVGARNDDTYRGAVHLFTKNGTQWAYHSKIAHNSNGLTLTGNDYFGSSAALSEDGATLMVGAPGDNTGGANNGAAYLFNLPDTVAPYIITQTFTNSTPANGNDPKTGDDLTFSFTFSETLPTAPTISIEGASATFTKTGDTYTATYQVINTTPEGPITYDINTLTDSAGQSFDPPETNSPFTVDRIAPTLAAIADGTSGGDSHIGTTADTTPDFSFTSDEAGTIAYAGSCTSSETIAVSGTNTVSFNALAYAAYTNCAVTVTDEAGNISSSLAVPNFTVQQIPEAIDDLVVSGIGYDQITLKWTTPADSGSAITEYEVQQNSGTWTAISGSGATTVSHTVTGLTPGTSDTFKVRATNSNGAAPESNTVTVIPNKFTDTIPDGLTLTDGDRFGSSAALSSNGATLAVGTRYDNTGSANTGAVHLFTKTGSTWTHSVKIDSNFTGLNLANDDQFGSAAALSSDGATLAVGAPHDDTGGTDTNRGAVHLFTKSNDVWTYNTKIAHGSNGLTLATNDYFGSAAALSSDGATLVVGARGDDTGGVNTNRGAVHLFTKNNNDVWTYSTKIAHGSHGLTLTVGETFGSAAALSSDGATLVIGARDDKAGGYSKGAVHLFTKSNNTWAHSVKIDSNFTGLNLANNDYFGISAALSSDGGALAVGANGDKTNGSYKGAVHLFTKNGTQWAYHSKIADGSNGLTLADEDYFGTSVTFSSDGTLVVGAYQDDTGGTNYNDSNNGAAYLFNLHDTVAPYITTQTFTNDNQTNDRYPKNGDSLTFSFTFSETLQTAPTISIEGASATFTKTGDTYTATYQVIAATAEGPITYDIDTLTDSAGQSFNPPETNSPFTVDRIAPVITLIGDSPLTLEVGDTYTDPGATADTGETVTASPTTVDVTTAGDYTITYTATDAAGNIGTKERVVSVIIDTVGPLLVTSLPTGTVLDITVTPSASGNTIFTLFDTPKQGTLDAVRVGTDRSTYVEFSGDPAKILGKIQMQSGTNNTISFWRPYHIDGTEGLNTMMDDLDTQNKSIYFVTNDGTYELDPGSVGGVGTGYAHFNSINVNGSPVLNAIRAQRAQFRLLVADESQTVHGGATSSTTIITSDNSNSAYAKEGDTLTLIFEVSEDLRSIPAVTIAGQTASVESTENTYTATYTVTADTPEGAVTHNIGILTDTAGNTTDPPLVTSAITLDTTAPVITVGTITPTGAAQSKTVSMTVADTNKKSDGYRYAITAGSTCDNTVIADNNAETAYTEGTDILLDQETYNTQYVCFRAEDEAGNTNYRVSGQITGISLASVESITFTSDNSNPAYAKEGDTITVTLVTDRELSTDPIVTVQGNTVTLTHTTGTTYTGTYQVTDTTDEGPIAYDIGALTDTTGTSDPPAGTDNSITIDTTGPLLPIPLPTGTVLDMTVTPSASGNVIVALYQGNNDPPIQGTLDTVRVGTDRSTYVEFSGDSANILGRIEMRSGTSAQISFWIPYLISPIGANTIMDNLNTQNKSIYFVTSDGTYELDPENVSNAGTGYAHFNGINVNGTPVLNAIRAQRAQFRLLVADEGQTVNGGVAPPTTTIITSNNSNSAYAKEGDTLTLIFTASEALRSIPTVTIADGTASVEAAGNIYTATYTVQTADPNELIVYNIGTLTDTAGNTADPPETTASVTLDTTPPVISLTGTSPLTLEVGDTYTDPGATAEAGATVTVSPTTIPTDTVGSHTVTYTATDAAGNIGTATRTVSVQASGTPQPPADTTPPSLSSQTLTSDNSNSAYAKEGDTLTLIFEVSEALRSVPSVTIMGQTVTPTAEENTYTADYTVTAGTPEEAVTYDIGILTDTAGNMFDPPEETASITIDTTAPVITLTGASPLTLEVGDTYTDPGATATEGVTVTTEGTVDTNTPGTYTITYTATDAAGNTATVERTVTVFVAGTLTIIVTNDEYTAPAPHKTVSATDTIADAADTVWHYIQIDSAAGDTACEADRFDGTETAYTEGADITLNSKDDNGDTICFKAVNEGNTYYKTSGVIGGIDQVAPTVTYTADKENFIKTGDTVQFTITLRDTGTIAAGTYLFTVSGAATGTCTVEVDVAAQTATQTCAMTITGTTEGQMVTITASELRDVFGNTNTPVPQNRLRLDLSAPTIESLGTPDVSQKKKVTLSLSAIHNQHNSNAGIPETLRPVFGGDCADFETAADWTDETPEDGQASAYEVTIPASGSYNNCTVKLVDAAGNESGQKTFSKFTIKKGGGSAGRVSSSFKQITSFFSGGYEKQIPGMITGAPQGSVFIDLPAVYQSVKLIIPEQVPLREIPLFAPTSGPEAPRGSVFIDLPAIYQSVKLTVPEQVPLREIPLFAPTSGPEAPRSSVFIDLPAAYQSVELTVPEQTPPTQQDVSPPQIPPATPPAEQPTVPIREQEPTPPQTQEDVVFIQIPANYYR